VRRISRSARPEHQNAEATKRLIIDAAGAARRRLPRIAGGPADHCATL